MSLDEILSLYLSPFGKKSLICRKTGMNKSVTQPKFSRSYAHQKTLSNISKRLAKRNISLEFVRPKTNSRSFIRANSIKQAIVWDLDMQDIRKTCSKWDVASSTRSPYLTVYKTMNCYFHSRTLISN